MNKKLNQCILLQSLVTKWPNLETKAEAKMRQVVKTCVMNVQTVMKDLTSAKGAIKNEADKMLDRFRQMYNDVTKEQITPDSLMVNVDKVLNELEEKVREILTNIRDQCFKSAHVIVTKEEEIKSDVLKIRQLFNKINKRHNLGQPELKEDIQLLTSEEVEEKVNGVCASLDKLIDSERVVPKASEVQGHFLTILSLEDVEKAMKKIKPQVRFSVKDMKQADIELLRERMGVTGTGMEIEEETEPEYVGSKDDIKDRQKRKTTVDDLKSTVKSFFDQQNMKPRVPYHCVRYAADGTEAKNCATKAIPSNLFELINTEWKKQHASAELVIDNEGEKIKAVMKPNIDEPSDLVPILDEIPTQFRCPACDEIFTTVNFLSIHYSDEHGNDDPDKPKKLEVCGFCARVYEDLSTARDCARSHFPFKTKKVNVCMICMYEKSTLVIKNTEGHLVDHISVNHLKKQIRPFHACGVCDKDCSTTMARSACQNKCLSPKDADQKIPWSCLKCNYHFRNYERKVKHFLKRHRENDSAREHDFFRLYLVGVMVKKEEDGKSVIIPVPKPSKALKFANMEGVQKVKCPVCAKNKKLEEYWMAYTDDESMLTKLKKHFAKEHKIDDIKGWLNETQQNFYDIIVI